MRAWIFDIEGTTTDIRFVHTVLFPYSLARMASFVQDHSEDSEVKDALANVVETLAIEGAPDATQAQCVEALCHWITTDRKHTALKTLQGLIWQAGYEAGDFVGHVYPDVPPVLAQLHLAGDTLGIYSSGSVAAQKLLFGYSNAGDLTPLFQHYFDTCVGGKREAASYQAILNTLNLPGEAVVFCSDVAEELDAAHQAGLRCVLVARDGQPEASAYPVISSFEALLALFPQALPTSA